ncbi:hypothetical protein BLI708_06670 [Bifidobacterium imperatoris]|uniref:Uncharacterized protein n=1 Tax=Bifidobacterium imperatoris TaxID=2020965 RepID=A0A2N5IQW2_9BIFI|nr:hypothetical protein [Bifidobacterium imperatoris]PLS24342.1 hypothetical protein Tam1G_1605 [Bifidobacterium imperatoris]QSY56956.1 hypothetical protein BLI708_06670 [Bifidobacterium imperatoris]
MNDYEQATAELSDKLTGLGGLVTQVTTDPASVKPTPGKASVWIEPPDYQWNGWHPMPPQLTFRLMVTAGTPTTQAKGLDVILNVLDLMHQANIPLRSAVPAGFNLANAGELAAYEITLNPI